MFALSLLDIPGAFVSSLKESLEGLVYVGIQLAGAIPQIMYNVSILLVVLFLPMFISWMIFWAIKALVRKRLGRAFWLLIALAAGAYLYSLHRYMAMTLAWTALALVAGRWLYIEYQSIKWQDERAAMAAERERTMTPEERAERQRRQTERLHPAVLALSRHAAQQRNRPRPNPTTSEEET